ADRDGARRRLPAHPAGDGHGLGLRPEPPHVPRRIPVPWLLTRALLYVAFVLAGAGVGAVVGDIVGAPQLGPAIGAALAVALRVVADELRAHRLMKWLRSDMERDAPRERGVWGEVAYRIERAMRQRDQALSQEQQGFAEFMSAIEASPNGVLL